MNAPLPHVNRTALWTAVSVIASQRNSTSVQPSAPLLNSSTNDPFAVVVSENGATLYVTNYAKSSASSDDVIDDTRTDRAVLAKYFLADRTGRRLRAVPRRSPKK